MDRMHYFFRCRRCHGLITRLQMQKAMETGPVLCACGSGTVGPTNPTGAEWLKPAVMRMTALKLMGQLEPAPEPTMPFPVPVGVRSVPAVADEEKWVSDSE